MFGQHLDVLPKEENKSFLTFVIPHDREGLLKVIISLSSISFIATSSFQGNYSCFYTET